MKNKKERADKIVVFVLDFIGRDSLVDHDVVKHLTQSASSIESAADVTDWLKSVKSRLASSRYKEMRTAYETSLMKDCGFENVTLHEKQDKLSRFMELAK